MTKTLKEILKYVTVAGVIVFISLLFPKHQSITSDVNVGDTWNKETLVAPFSFPIIRSEEEINSEKQKIAEDFYGYYILKTNADKQVKSILAHSLHLHF